MDRRRLPLAFFAAACLLAAGDIQARDPAPPGPLRIGVAGPMSGPQGRVGQALRNAVELAAQDWNASGGLLGRPIEVLVGDDEQDPRVGVLVARRLAADGAWGVVGHLGSEVTIPASAVYHEAGIPLVAPAATNPRLTEQGFANVFRVCGRDDQQGAVAARHAVEGMGKRRIAVVDDGTPYGESLTGEFRRQVERRGRRLLVAAETIPLGTRDLAPVVARLQEADPDLIFFGGLYPEAGLLLRQLRQQGIQATFMSGDGALDPGFIKVAGEEAASGALFTFAPDVEHLPAARRILADYERRYGPPGPYPLQAYFAAQVLFRGIAAGGPNAGDRAGRMRIARAIRRLTVESPWGPLRWDAKGDLVTPPYVVYVTRKGGKILGWFEPLAAPLGAHLSLDPVSGDMILV